MYSDFQPVRDWIENNNCKIIYGGTDYKNHLNNHKRFLGHLTEQDRKGKTKHLNDDEVDRVTDTLKGNYTRADFDDHHIVAIVLISRCKIVCSLDIGLKNLIDECYGSGRTTIKRQLRIGDLRKPKIYRGRGSASTLRRRTSSDNCGPCS
jgi:hypothetical protein